MNENNALLNRCMDILCKGVGIVEAETFIFLIRSEDFDYTKWQKGHYDSMTPEQIKKEMQEFSKSKPFEGNKATII